MAKPDTTHFGSADRTAVSDSTLAELFIAPKIEPEPPPSFTIDEWVQMTRFASNVQEWQIEQVVALANWVAKITGR